MKKTILLIIHLLLQLALFVLMVSDRQWGPTSNPIEQLPATIILFSCLLFFLVFLPAIRKMPERTLTVFTMLSFLMLLLLLGTFSPLRNASWDLNNLYSKWELYMGNNGQYTDMATYIHPIIWSAISACLFFTLFPVALENNKPAKPIALILKFIPAILSTGILLYLLFCQRPEFQG